MKGRWRLPAAVKKPWIVCFLCQYLTQRPGKKGYGEDGETNMKAKFLRLGDFLLVFDLTPGSASC